VSIKREAAFHEAGHAVMAYFARFHGIVGSINLEDYGAGEIYVALLSSKCAAEGLAPVPEAARRPDVARDLGLILVSGLIAEQIAAENDEKVKPNLSCSEPDHALLKEALANSGLSRKFDQLEDQARSVLREHWQAVEVLAAYLLEHVSADPIDIDQVLQPILS